MWKVKFGMKLNGLVQYNSDIEQTFDSESAAVFFIKKRIMSITGSYDCNKTFNPDGTCSYEIGINTACTYFYTPHEARKNKQKAIIMVGVPGSGKSYIAGKIAEDLQNTKIVSTDKIREELFGDPSDNKHNSKVFDEAHKRFGLFLNEGKNVIFDATSIKKEYRKSILNSIPKDRIDHVETICLHVVAPIKTCKKRNKCRERQVPYYVIDGMNKNLEVPKTYEGFDFVAKVYNG